MASNEPSAPTPQFLALLLGLEDQQGHQYDYGRAVQTAVGLAGWPYQAAVPLSCRIDPLPAGWVHALDRGQYRYTGNLLRKAQSVWTLGRSIARYLRQARRPGQPAIVFVEFFNYVQLTALLLGILGAPRAGLAVWLVYRLPVHADGTRRVYQGLHSLLRGLVGEEHLVLLTDATPLVVPLQHLFDQRLTVLPIPHALPDAGEPVTPPAWPTPRPRYVAWWPGRAAVDKGIARLAHLAADTGPAAAQWGLVATASAGLHATTGGPSLRALPDALPRAEYWGWLQEADLIVLPYLAEWYHARTSGVFVEAIAAGKPVAVTASTWMANELLAYDLPELIVEWDDPDPWARLASLVEDTGLRPRLATMAAAYRERHTPAGFAEALRHIAAPAARAEAVR